MADELVANLFFTKSVSTGVLDPYQFEGLMILDEPLKYRILKAVRDKDLMDAVSNADADVALFEQFPDNDRLRERLEALAIGVTGSLIATAIVEFITRFVFSSPHGAPNLREVEVTTLETAAAFPRKNHPVSARAVAVKISCLEFEAIERLNAISAFEIVDEETRSYALTRDTFGSVMGCYIHHTTETIESGSLFSSALINHLGRKRRFHYSSKRTDAVVERLEQLGRSISWIESSPRRVTEYEVDKIRRQYLSSYL
jgi:hypothetical protein